MPVVPTLKDRFNPRSNGFDVLRLLFALAVAAAHGLAIGFGGQPTWGETELSALGLDGFFILSGFLVTRSFLQRDDAIRYAWHRFLRLMPGFWVCLLATALLVAPLAAVLKGLPVTAAFTGEPSAWQYLAGNAGLLITQYEIAGILSGTPLGDSFNGSLWTLFFEAACYAAVAGLGLLGVLRRRPWVVLAMTAGLAVLTGLQEAGVPVLLNDRVLRLGFVFLLGAVAYLFADRIPMSASLAAVAAVLFLAGVSTFDDYRVIGAAPLAYVFLWLGTSPVLRWSMRTDLSYGLYLYHWPVFQVLAVAGLAVAGSATFLLAGLALTVPPAVLSWFAVEKPALRRKNQRLPWSTRGRHATRGRCAV